MTSDIGKWLNIIEELWHVTKSKGRVNIPIADRNSDQKVKQGLRRELVAICKDHRVLQHTILNSMRFTYAVLRAVFYGERVVYKEKPLLFAELFEGFHDFGCKLLQGEAEENVDADMAPRGIDLEEPPKLLAPRKTATEIKEGSWVLYWSKTHNWHIHCHVKRINPDDTVDLTIKPRARLEHISIPKVPEVAPKPPPAKRAKTAQEAGAGEGVEADEGSESGAATDDDGEGLAVPEPAAEDEDAEDSD